ncbi:MAG: hypothetical protein NWF07_13795 [Candidatus Bathyarchaeota archaeon]|nr:hypothetical protein [Candidatus Bathyarchaeota archaeon]
MGKLKINGARPAAEMMEEQVVENKNNSKEESTMKTNTQVKGMNAMDKLMAMGGKAPEKTAATTTTKQKPASTGGKFRVFLGEEFKKSARNPYWYRDVEGTTDQRSNPALGILDIHLSSSEKMRGNFVCFAKIKLGVMLGEEEIGTVLPLNKVYYNEDTGALSFMSRSIKEDRKLKDGEEDKDKWLEVVEIPKEVKAQVLRYVEKIATVENSMEMAEDEEDEE